MALTLKMRIKSERWAQALETHRQQIAEVVAKTAFDIEADAKQNAHVITGYLRNSIQAEVEAGLPQARVVVGAEYGWYEEYGTRHRPAHPFLTPAVEANRAGYFAALRRILPKR